MAFCTVFLFTGSKGPGAVMTFTAELARIYISHFHNGRSFFHLEYFLMAVHAFKPGVGVFFAIQDNLTHRRIPCYGFPGLNCLHTAYKNAADYYRHNRC